MKTWLKGLLNKKSNQQDYENKDILASRKWDESTFLLKTAVDDTKTAVDNLVADLKDDSKDTKRKLRYISEIIYDAAVVADENGVIEMFSKRAEEMFGFTENETLGKNVKMLMPEYVAREHDHIIAQAENKENDTTVHLIETEGKRKKGEIFPIDLNLKSLNTDTGRKYVAIIRDLSQRRIIEKRLQEAEHTIKSLVNNSDIGYFVLTEDGEIVEVNRIFCSFFNMGYDRLVGRNLLDYVDESCIPELSNKLKTIHSDNEKSYEYEVEVHTQTPTKFIAGTISTSTDSSNNVYVSGFAKDITEKRIAEIEKRKTQERLERIIANLGHSHFIYFHDTDGIFRYVSESVYDMLGYTTEEFLTHYKTYMPDTIRNKTAEQYTLMGLSGVEQPPYEVDICHKNGKMMTLEITEIPIYDENNKLLGIEGIAQNITQRTTQAKLITVLYSALNNTTDSVLIADTNQKIIFVNEAFTKRYGYSYKEVIGKKPKDIVKSGQHTNEFYDELIQTIMSGNTWSGDIINVTKDGTLINEQLTAIPIMNGIKNPIYYISFTRPKNS